jgi:copper chaperone NosL
MKNDSINIWVRVSLALCGILLLLVLIFPMWRIELTAPQYPEGLALKIYPGKLGGDVDIVNGLNHYIGMKTLHAKDFIEFTVLPYLIIFFALCSFAVALFNRKVLLYTFAGLFMLFAVLAMADFWRWEYNYGHNLDPHAAIQVPGMSYQPPFLGYKQLLNFGAFSIPGTGGWLFFSVGIILVAATSVQMALSKRGNRVKGLASLLLPLLLFSLNSCNTNPQALKIGSDNCAFCKMVISDNRFGGEIVTPKGKIYKFDDIQCILAFVKSETESFKEASFYFTDFDTKHELLKSSESFLLQSDKLKAPMNGNMAAFSSRQNLEQALTTLSGQEVKWSALLK